MEFVLAVDVGTQSLKACIIDRSLNILEESRVPYDPDTKPGKKVEIDARVLWDAFVTACVGLKRKSEISALSFSTLCPSLLPMNSEGEPLHPVILHLDRRSYRQSMWALDRVGEKRFFETAGNLPIPGGISLTSLLWIKQNEPAVYEKKGVIFGHVVSYFMKKLTGRFAIDPSNASFTGLYDTVGYTDWDEGLLEKLEIDPEKLPPVAMSKTVIGTLDERVAASTGLPKGIAVVIGANDTTCASVASGVTRPGSIMNTTGTVEIMVLCMDRPLVSKDHLIRTHAYPDRWLHMRTVGAGGASMEWFRRTFCKDMTRETFYSDYLAEVLAKDRIPEARFHPFLTGDRHRIKQKSGSFTCLTLHTTREDCLYALALAIVEFQFEGLRQWKKSVSLERNIYTVGGGASDAYTQFKQRYLADFKFVQLGEASVKGAAILGFETLDGV